MKQEKSTREKKLEKILLAIMPIYEELYKRADPDGEIATHVQYEIEAQNALKEEHEEEPETVTISRVVIQSIADPDPDPSYLDQPCFSERKKQYENGDFYYIGLRATASLIAGGICQEVTSAGLWSIESDSDSQYLLEVASEQIEELKECLKTLNVDTQKFHNKFVEALSNF